MDWRLLLRQELNNLLVRGEVNNLLVTLWGTLFNSCVKEWSWLLLQALNDLLVSIWRGSTINSPECKVTNVIPVQGLIK